MKSPRRYSRFRRLGFRSRTVAPDDEGPRLFRADGTGQAGLDAALASAGESLRTGDLVWIGQEIYYAYVGTQYQGTHLVPLTVPASPSGTPDSFGWLPSLPTLLTAFSGVDPTNVDGEGTALEGWAFVQTGNGARSVEDGELTLSAPDASSRAYLSWSPDEMPTSPLLAVFYGVQGVAAHVVAARCPQIQLRTAEGDRTLTIRPDSASDSRVSTVPWEVDTAGSDLNVTGTQVGTETVRLELLFDPTTDPAAIRTRGRGPGFGWDDHDETALSLSSTISLFLDSGRDAAGQSLTVKGAALFALS